jgi:hypothetical protein
VVLQILALQGRFDGLGNCPVYSDLDKCADVMIRNRNKISSGFETLGPFARQPGRQGNVEMTVFNSLKANPLFIQLWFEDAVSSQGVKTAKQINTLYKKYKDWTIEEIRADLQKQGKYLQNYKWENREQEDRRLKWLKRQKNR